MVRITLTLPLAVGMLIFVTLIDQSTQTLKPYFDHGTKTNLFKDFDAYVEKEGSDKKDELYQLEREEQQRHKQKKAGVTFKSPPALVEAMFQLFVRTLFGPHQTKTCLQRIQCELGHLLKRMPSGHEMLKYLIEHYVPTKFQYLSSLISAAVENPGDCRSMPCDRFIRKDEL